MNNRRIIVNCAPSGLGHGANLGMLTVDYAIFNILREFNLDNNIEVRSLWSPYDSSPLGKQLKAKDSFALNIKYGPLNHQKLKKSDTIIYWGDFQWGFDFQIQTAKRIQQKNDVLTYQEALDIAYSQFMLNDLFKNKVAPKIMSYGTTLFQNKISDYFNDKYSANLKWLIRNSEYIKFRDPYSSCIAEQITRNFENNHLGMDAALLNKSSELLSLSDINKEFVSQFEGKIGYFFGRSTKSFPFLSVIKFLNRLTQRLNTKAIKLPWSHFTGSGLFSSTFDKVFKHLGHNQQVDTKMLNFNGDLFKAMRNCSLIVTDTYHVAINAIALDIPVVMIPEFRPAEKRNANMGYVESWRDKRVMLFQSNNLSDLMVLPDLLKKKSYMEDKVNLITEITISPSILENMYSGLHQKAAYDRRTIGHLLSQIASD